MVSAVMVMVLLAAGDPLEDVAPEAHAVLEQRPNVRVRGGIGFAGQVAYPFPVTLLFPGVGFAAEAGAMLSDRFAVSARLTFTTIAILSSVTLGLQFDAVVTEHLMLGVGATWCSLGGLDAPGSSGVGVPVRLSFSPASRTWSDVSRRGLSLFAEVMPALAYTSFAGLARRPIAPNPLILSALVGVGYAWW